MRFEWDSAKAKANIARHGVSFEDAKVFADSHAIESLDDSSTEEERWRLLGRAGRAILVVVYTERREGIRLISARKANKYEQRVYLEQDH